MPFHVILLRFFNKSSEHRLAHTYILAGTWQNESLGRLLARMAFGLTVAYAGTIFWLAPHPPMVDLPQHAGQIALLRDLIFGESTWQPLLRINYFTPYLIGYGLALPLSLLMSVAAALKLLLTLAFYAFVYCSILLRRHFHGDERLDWLFIPGFFGFAYAWGFFTFLVAAPVGLVFVLLANRYAKYPSAARGSSLIGVGLVLFFSHGLVFLFACCIGVALLVVRHGRPGKFFFALLPYAPMAILSVVYALVSHNAEAIIDNGPPGVLWQGYGQRLQFLTFIFGAVPYDVHDALFAGAGVIMLWAPRLLRSSLNRREPAAFVPMAAMLFVWLVVPHYAMKTTLIYHRFALFILPFYALMFCRPPPEADRIAIIGLQARVGQVLLALLCWIFIATHTERAIRFAQETRDFDIVRSAAEPAQRALALIFDADSAAAKNTEVYGNYPLWYQAENGGLVDFNFAWAPPQIVRYRKEHFPAVRPYWSPKKFSWDRDQGWQYRYFFVRHAEPLSPSLFENDRCRVSLLKSSGSWSLYEPMQCS